MPFSAIPFARRLIAVCVRGTLASYYVFTSFFLSAWRSSHVQFIARTYDSLYGRATFLPGYNTGGSAAREDREGDLQAVLLNFSAKLHQEI